MPALVQCPVCGGTFTGSGAGGTTVPGHGAQWRSCPGSYEPGRFLNPVSED